MVLRKKDDSDWAESALYDTVWEQPAIGWELIREISRSANSSEILEELANGPLHQLLVEHPEVLIEHRDRCQIGGIGTCIASQLVGGAAVAAGDQGARAACVGTGALSGGG